MILIKIFKEKEIKKLVSRYYNELLLKVACYPWIYSLQHGICHKGGIFEEITDLCEKYQHDA